MLRAGRETAGLRGAWSKLSEERGVTMVVAVSVLMVLGILVAGVSAAALDLNQSSSTDRGSKRALAAAEAGLSAATFRVNHASNSCSTAPLAQTDCGPFTETLADGSSYSNYVSPVLGTSELDSCVGVPVTAPSGQAVEQRCITATGTAGGVVRRLQIRIGAFTNRPYFPVGLLGQDYVRVGCAIGGGTAYIKSDIGSNGEFCAPQPGGVNNLTVCGTIYLASGGTYSGGIEGCPTNPSPFPPAGHEKFETPDIGCVFDDSNCSTPALGMGNTASVNHNAKLVPLLWSMRCGQLVDASGKAIDWGSSLPATPPPGVRLSGDRELDLRSCSAGASVVLPPGTYNFCRLTLPNSATLGAQGAATGAAPVNILIDSPYRPGSRCGVENGGTSVAQRCSRRPAANKAWNCADGQLDFGSGPSLTSGDSPAEPESFMFYIYGNPPSKSEISAGATCPKDGVSSQMTCPPPQHTVVVANAGVLEAGLVAPYSVFTMNNVGNFVGAVNAQAIDVINSFKFTYDPDLAFLGTPTNSRLYYRTAWGECRRAPVDGGQRSGC